jgi:hypothetical protein
MLPRTAPNNPLCIHKRHKNKSTITMLLFQIAIHTPEIETVRCKAITPIS